MAPVQGDLPFLTPHCTNCLCCSFGTEEKGPLTLIYTWESESLGVEKEGKEDSEGN